MLAADIADQLAKNRCSLCIGNAVEVHLDIGKITDLSGNGVSGGELILVHAPVLAEHEAGPTFCVLGCFGQSQVAHEFSERLIEPQIVPPLHGDQIAKPHVCQLVEDRIGASFQVSSRGAGTENVLVAESDTAGVLHRTRVVFGNEDLIVGLEGVRNTVSGLEEGESLAGDFEDAIRIQGVDEGCAAPYAERNRAAITGDQGIGNALVGASNNRSDVGGDALGFFETIRPAILVNLRLGGSRVREDLPACRNGDRESEGRLEVGLLESRKDAAGIRHLKLRVAVGL